MSASASSKAITVPAIELRDDYWIPRSTFESEVKRLRLQAEAMDRDWGDGKYLTRKINALVKLLYGKKCWVCKEQITVYFDGSQPILRPVHPDDTDGKMIHSIGRFSALSTGATTSGKHITSDDGLLHKRSG